MNKHTAEPMVSITLTKSDIEWLEDLLMNPINVRFPQDEKKDDKRTRLAIYNTITMTRI